MKLILIACAAVLAHGTAAAYASPSAGGYTGLINVPTSDALTSRSYNFGYGGGQSQDVDFNNTYLNYGLNLDELSNCEVGIDHRKLEGSSAKTYINAKLGLRKEGEKNVGVAAGVIDVMDSNETTLYIVASKTLRMGGVDEKLLFNPRVTAGFGAGALDGLFFGLTLDVAKNVILMAEYDSDDFNLGLRAHVLKHLTAQVNLFDFGGDEGLGGMLSYGVDY